jgi:hypothetical protein
MKYLILILSALVIYCFIQIFDTSAEEGYEKVITSAYEEVSQTKEIEVRDRLNIVTHYLIDHKGLSNGEKTRREAAIYYASHIVAYISLDFEKTCLDLANVFNAHPHTCDLPEE